MAGLSGRVCLAFRTRKQFRFVQHDHNVLVVKVSVPAMELVSGGMFVVMYATLKDDPVLATFDSLWCLPGSRKVPKKLWEMYRGN